MAVDFQTVSVTAVISAGNTSVTLTEGVDYTLPTGPANGWFAEISNNNHTGMGDISSGKANQKAQNFTAWISSQTAGSIVITRVGTLGSTRVDFQIVAYIGVSGGNNEIIVRETGVLTAAGVATTASTVVSGIVDTNDVVPYLTGSGTDYGFKSLVHVGMSTLTIAGSTLTATSRGQFDTNSSYAIVEYVGINWTVNSENYTLADTPFTLTNPVADLTKTFIHTQTRCTNANGQQGLDDVSFRTWLTSTTQLAVDAQTNNLSNEKSCQTYIVENSASGEEAMIVQRVTGTTMSGAGEEEVMDISITTLGQLNNASLNGLGADSTGSGTAFPRGFVSFAILDDSTVRIKQSDNGQTTIVDFEVVSWPQTSASTDTITTDYNVNLALLDSKNTDYSVTLNLLEQINTDYNVNLALLDSKNTDYSVTLNLRELIQKNFDFNLNLLEEHTVDFNVVFNLLDEVTKDYIITLEMLGWIDKNFDFVISMGDITVIPQHYLIGVSTAVDFSSDKVETIII